MEFVKVSSSEQIEKTAAVAADIWRRHYVSIVGSAQVEYMLEKFQSPAAIAEQITQGYLYYLLKEGGEIVGYIAMQPNKDDGSMFLSKYYVSENYRGCGYGKEAMNFIKQECRQMNCPLLWLTVNKHNTNSLKIYEKLGFENAGSVVADIGGGYVMDDYKMVCRC